YVGSFGSTGISKSMPVGFTDVASASVAAANAAAVAVWVDAVWRVLKQFKIQTICIRL
ncbi:hypothetical protein A2U01_0048625, partial [Trifolium medium]|nr:hypothetical protein [Trifolium medium]